MVDLTSGQERERRLDAALEAIHFGFRALVAHPDRRLAERGYSRIHHRILYFIGRNPGCSISELRRIMRVSKQYLHAPLRRLVADGLVRSEVDRADRRVRRLSLSATGAGLEEELTGEQRRLMDEVFRAAGREAECGWRRVMELLAARLLDVPDREEESGGGRVRAPDGRCPQRREEEREA